ncbi:MAG: chorismate synthase [bacterium]
MIRFLTAGESHGRNLTAVIEGLPAGLKIDVDFINGELSRRQAGYGRGPRMRIEKDKVDITAGVRFGRTLGNPVVLVVPNLDWQNWEEIMSVSMDHPVAYKKITRPRPGHADFAGAIKYHHDDIRNVLERSSARETTMRVAAGAVCKLFLREFGIEIKSDVVEIGGIKSQALNSEKKIKSKIDKAVKEGNSLGGIFEIQVLNAPVGLGSYVHWDRRLDGKLAQALMSIPAIKGVEIGLGFEAGRRLGSDVHDEIFYRGRAGRGEYYRKTNNAGGLEGGMTNGEPIIIRASMKPIPTLKTPLSSVDMSTKKMVEAGYERSDVCAVYAASVIGEAMIAMIIADTFLEKFGGDSMDEIKAGFSYYKNYVKRS